MRIKVRIAKKLSKVSTKVIWIVFALIFISIILVPILALICPPLKESCFARIWVDIFSSVGLRNIAYGHDKDSTGLGSAIAYAFGVVFLTGVLVPVVTNRLRTLGERYLNGTLDRYDWKKHVLFIGYDELMIGTLKKACENTKKNKGIKRLKSIVIAVPNDVQHVRELLFKHFSNNNEEIEVVQCNQNDIDDLLKKARIMTASRIYIIGQPDNPTHDAHNLRTLAYIAEKWKDLEIAEKRKNTNYDKTPHIMVYLRNQSTFSLLQRQGFLAENIWGIIGCSFSTKDEKEEAQKFVDRHCEYFNFYCDKALRMLSSSPENGGMSLIWHSPEKNIANPKMGNRQVHFVVLGMTQMGTALVRELLRLAHPSGKGTKLLITMVDENAYEEMHFFIGRTKELFKLCHYSYYDYNNLDMEKEIKPKIEETPKNDFLDVEFEFIQCDVAHPHLTEQLLKWSADENQLLTLVICTNDSPKNMATVMYLPPEMFCGENAVPTWVYQEGDDSVRQLLDHEHYPEVHPFSFADHAVASTANSPIYEWDREVVKYYEEHYKTDKVAEQWENKSQDKRWSSLYSIRSIGIKLHAVGILDATRYIDESKKKLIDYYEHNRWVVERLTMGSRQTDSKQHEEVIEELQKLLTQYSDWKTNEKSRKEIEKHRTVFNDLKNGVTVKGIRIHDDIRPFEDLTPYTVAKDRKMLDDYLESIKNNPQKKN